MQLVKLVLCSTVYVNAQRGGRPGGNNGEGNTATWGPNTHQGFGSCASINPTAGDCCGSHGGCSLSVPGQGTCFCDTVCVEYGDCCMDYGPHCMLIGPAPQAGGTDLVVSEDQPWTIMQEYMSQIGHGDKFSDLIEHGCHCAKIQLEAAEKEYVGGFQSVDGLDAICKQWFEARYCHTLTDGNCASGGDSAYKVTFDGGAIDQCASASGASMSDCQSATCAVDTHFAEQIGNYLDNNGFTKVDGNQGVCEKNFVQQTNCCITSTAYDVKPYNPANGGSC